MTRNTAKRVFTFRLQKKLELCLSEATPPRHIGGVATVDFHTSSKTVPDYLIKPRNKASEALRER